MILRHWKVNKENFIFKKKKEKGRNRKSKSIYLSIIIKKKKIMTQTLELTTAELALIENARMQEVLNLEAEALRAAARLEQDIIEEEAAIRKEQNSNNDQVIATKDYLKELQKLNPNYKLVEEEKELTRQIKGEYLPDSTKRSILKEFKYIINQVHITLEGTPFKVDVKKHFVYGSRWSTRATDKGYKMNLIGGGFYNERLLSNPKTLNNKIEDKIQSDKDKEEAKIKKANALEYVSENLSNLYPDAIINTGREWLASKWDKSGGEYIDIVGVKLANGIKIKFRVFSDKSISRMEITFPVKDSYQLLELMNGLVIPE